MLTTAATHRLHRVGHLQAGHDDAQPAAAEAAHGDLVLDLAQLAATAGPLGAQDAHVVQLLQEQRLVLVPHRVVGLERRELVRELPTQRVGSVASHQDMA